MDKSNRVITKLHEAIKKHTHNRTTHRTETFILYDNSCGVSIDTGKPYILANGKKIYTVYTYNI